MEWVDQTADRAVKGVAAVDLDEPRGGRAGGKRSDQVEGAVSIAAITVLCPTSDRRYHVSILIGFRVDHIAV